MFQFRRLLVRYQPFIAPGVILVAVVLIVIFAIFPAIQQTIQEFQDVASLREQVEVLQKKVTVLNNLDEEKARNLKVGDKIRVK